MFSVAPTSCLVVGVTALLRLVLLLSLEGSDYLIYRICRVSLLEGRSSQFVVAFLIDVHSHKSIIPAERKLGL